MLKSVEGIYRDGKIELIETPANMDEDTPVIVTFLTGQYVDLRAGGISRKQALVLRERLSGFAEDWDSPEMELYDRYDTIKSSD
ncbi:MAG TPA: hypothetical protein PK205_10440 [Promineifilum sp.]|nr:hypothetical protein [Promineifilum sp.]HRQ13713.1 hypothetical protein [Promineifilum sp.]